MARGSTTCIPFHTSPMFSRCRACASYGMAGLVYTECSLFRPGFPPPEIPEEWPTTAWEHPALSASPRADYLDSFTPFPTGADFGIFSDGGFSGGDKASFSCQARSFGDPPGYWDSSTVMTSPIVSRLPTAYGNAACDIHTAELMGMIAGLRYAQPGNWNLYVGDRSSLFSLLRSLSDAHTPQGVLRSANIPLATQTTLQAGASTRLRSLTSGMSKNLMQSDMSGTVRLPSANLVW